MKRMTVLALACVLLAGAKAPAQPPLREIRETVTDDFAPDEHSTRVSPLLMGSKRIGVQSLHEGVRHVLRRVFL